MPKYVALFLFQMYMSDCCCILLVVNICIQHFDDVDKLGRNSVVSHDAPYNSRSRLSKVFSVYEISELYSTPCSALVFASEYYVVTARFPFPEASLFFPDVLFQCIGQSFLNNFTKYFT